MLIPTTVLANTMPSTDGWVAAGETWVYGSADDPTYAFTTSGDLTGKYSAGMRVRVSQATGGTKYFIVTNVEFAGGTTTITVYGGTDYDMANEAISSPYYSVAKAPAGFPLDPAKWTVTLTDTSSRTQASPVQNTWYNLGSLSLDIPIGVWETEYAVLGGAIRTSGLNLVETTLSTGNNTESDEQFTARSYSDANATL